MDVKMHGLIKSVVHREARDKYSESFDIALFDIDDGKDYVISSPVDVAPKFLLVPLNLVFSGFRADTISYVGKNGKPGVFVRFSVSSLTGTPAPASS